MCTCSAIKASLYTRKLNLSLCQLNHFASWPHVSPFWMLGQERRVIWTVIFVGPERWEADEREREILFFELNSGIVSVTMSEERDREKRGKEKYDPTMRLSSVWLHGPNVFCFVLFSVYILVDPFVVEKQRQAEAFVTWIGINELLPPLRSNNRMQ